MAASIHTFPPARSMSLGPIWVELETSLWADDPIYFELIITGTNSEDETIALTWGGTSLGFTLKDSPDASGLQLPTYTSGTVAAYAQALAEALRQNELLFNDFTVTVTGSNTVLLRYRYSSALETDHAETVSNFNIMASVGNGGSITAENLRALVQVYRYAGNLGTDPRLASFHAPYGASTGIATLDIGPAFVSLRPHLPSPASILGFASGLASDAFMQYYWRYADKHGTPAVAEAMQPMLEGAWHVIYGGAAGDAQASTASGFSWPDEDLRHCYMRRNSKGIANGLSFHKPIGEHQPDWVYVWNNSAGNREVGIHVHRQDGTEEELPRLDPVALAAKSLYWFSAGPGQLGLDIWADPDNPITRYTWSLYRAGTNLKITTVQYELLPDCQDWGLALLFDNGLGGCETVWLKGKATEGYDAASTDTVQRPRQPGWAPDLGEFDKLGTQGQPTWEASTGLFDDDAYLLHLRQLPLSSSAWIVDTENQRFLKVLVEAKRIESVRQDDQDLFHLAFSLRAAWADQASNL
jgi:hypothetical protein